MLVSSPTILGKTATLIGNRALVTLDFGTDLSAITEEIVKLIFTFSDDSGDKPTVQVNGINSFNLITSGHITITATDGANNAHTITHTYYISGRSN